MAEKSRELHGLEQGQSPGSTEATLRPADRMPSPDLISWPGRSPEANQAYGISDPLRITYLLVMEDERLDRMTAFQGFGRGWWPLIWALYQLAELPAQVLEPTWPLDSLLRQRIGGASGLSWMPIMASALDSLMLDEVGFCVVMFTGTEPAARRAAAWAARQPRPVLHVSSIATPRTMTPDAMNLIVLRDHCRAVYQAHGGEISPDRRARALEAIEAWTPRQPVSIDLDELGHNCTTPNHMVLRRAGRSLGEGIPHWSSIDEDAYTAAILASATAVMDVRKAVGTSNVNRLFVPLPKIVLTEPALFRFAYGRGDSRGTSLAPATVMMIRRMQQQKGLAHLIEPKQLSMLEHDGEWQGAVAERQTETAVQTAGVGLMAAQSCAAVVRLRPEVNHVFPRLSEFARNIRAVNPHARAKSPQLLQRLQDALARAVGPERIDFVRRYGGPVRIVSDAPLELLPIDGLPLALRYDTSRINATPGNLMMGELAGRVPITVDYRDLLHVLVVSSFNEDDQLRDFMREALDQLEEVRPGEFTIDFRRVTTVDEFVEVVNGSTAPIMIFDGHGVQDDGRGLGGLRIGGQTVDIWRLRDRMRCPPIVILSACDTHGLDAPSHSTVGNSFLAVGASTVLATVLPVGGREGALFIYRALLHLAGFVPAAIEVRMRLISWTEVMAGVLRLSLAKDVLDHLTRRGVLPDESDRAIFRGVLRSVLDADSDWFETMMEAVASAAVPHHGRDLAGDAQAGIARSEAIRYIQLGRPERITVGTRELLEALVPVRPYPAP